MELNDKYNIDLDSVVEDITNNQFNPAAVFQVAANRLNNVFNGEVSVINASHPMTYLMEMSSVNCAVTNNYIDSTTRKLYPELAQTEEDLNRHLSDKEDYDRFATPLNTTFHVLLDRLSIEKYAVDDGNGRRIIIPEETRFQINDIFYGIYYPIVINILSNGTITVLWDIDEQNPLSPISTNEITYLWRKSSNPAMAVGEILDIEIPVSQFYRKRYTSPLNSSVGFVKEYSFTDKYYVARVYTGDSDSGWTELHTTHSFQVYNNDDTVATALLQVYDNTLRVAIPQIYFTQGILGTNLRVDIMTTKGNQTINFSDYDINLFTAEWLNNDPATKKYSTPLNKFAVASIYSNVQSTGGTDGLEYEELRSRVINNAITNDYAITPDQLNVALSDMGYDLVTYKDYITENLYIATKNLPAIYLDDVAVTAGCGMLILSASNEELLALDTVIDNVQRYTITPDTLYRIVDGVLYYCTDAERQTLESSSSNDKINALNNAEYLYSPFYHVYDNSSTYFDYRPYYLNAPSLTGKYFQGMNDTTDLQVTTDSLEFTKTDTGWLLQFKTVSSGGIKSLDPSTLIPQVFFTGEDEVNPAYANAEYLATDEESGEFIYQVKFESNHDINADDELTITNFQVREEDNISKDITLTKEINVIYTVNSYNGVISRSELDSLSNLDFVPSDSIVLTHETLLLKFGDNLDGLFKDYRTISGGVEYETYPDNIEARYPNDVWETDADGEIIYTANPDYDETDPTSPPLVGKILYKKGEVIVINGETQYIHTAGNPVLDADGNMIQKTGRTTINECNLFLLDAKFRYATEPNSVTYADSLPKSIITYLEDDINPIEEDMLNLTEIAYYPKKSVGVISVSTTLNSSVVINATQSPTVDVFVDKVTYNDTRSRSAINKSIKQIMVDYIRLPSVNIDDIYSAINDSVGSSVISVHVHQFGKDESLPRFTVNNQNEAANIGTKLELQSDGTLKLVDTININFYQASEDTGVSY